MGSPQVDGAGNLVPRSGVPHDRSHFPHPDHPPRRHARDPRRTDRGRRGPVTLTAAPAEARGWSADLDPAELKRRVEYGVGRALGRVEATDDQKKKVADILNAAIDDLRPMREQHMTARQAMRQALSAASVDKPGLERLRAEQVQLADRASQRFLRAVTDASDLLYPEQRRKLVQAMGERRGWRR